MATKEKLTLMQENFCREYVSGEFAGNARQCYLKVSKKKDMTGRRLDTYSYMLTHMPKIINEIQRLREAAGLTDEFVTKKIREGIEAMTTASYRGKVYDSDMPDYKTRLKYLEVAAKLLNMYPSSKVDHRNLNLDLQVEKMTPEQLTGLLTSMAGKINVKPKRKDRVSSKDQEKLTGTNI